MDPGFTVMARGGIDAKYTVGREGWTTIKCASKRAYGCGESGNWAVQDLDLLWYHGDLENLSSFISVRAGDKVFRWIDQLMAERGVMRAFCFKSKVEIVNNGLIVLTLSFSGYGGFHYYLIFDSVETSLSMIPCTPDRVSCYTRCPLPVRHDDGGYSLVLFGCEFGYGRGGGKTFLWLYSPSLAESSVASSGPWQRNELSLPTEMKYKLFSPDLLFSSNGLAFWTDLALGTLYCNCSHLAWGVDVVDFSFIELPPGCQVDRNEETWSVEAYRTMGCDGGYIKFVSIDKPDDQPQTRVKVWTLAPDGLVWELYSDIPLKSLWKDFKRAGLPKSLPMWPMLWEMEGSTLYFMLAEETQTKAGVPKHYLCQLDMGTNRLLQSNLLTHMWSQRSAILPSGFFKYPSPVPSRLEPVGQTDATSSH